MSNPSIKTNQNARAVLMRFRELYLETYEAEETDMPECVLASYVANRFPMPPVWLLVVGAPSSGKTTALELISDLPQVVSVSTITVAALLSGSPNRDKNKDSTGGILRVIGENGVMVFKDFTSTLSMRSDKQLEVMSALREIHDGSWTRWFGTDFGKSEVWKGKAGVIGAVTQIIDQRHAAMATMGERFLYFRIPANREQSVRIARRALGDETSRARNTRELKKLIKSINDLAEIPDGSMVLPEEFKDMLITLSCMVSRCRTGIDRNSYNREIESVPFPEEPARLIKQLLTLFYGLLEIGNTAQEAWLKVMRVGFSSIPELRLKAIRVLRKPPQAYKTSEIAKECNSPTTTTERALEDLSYLDLVNCSKLQSSKLWALTEEAGELLDGVECDFQMDECSDGIVIPQVENSPDLTEIDLYKEDAKTEGIFRVSPTRSTQEALCMLSRTDKKEHAKGVAKAV